MQTHGGVPAADAIEQVGGERFFRPSLMVDWNKNGLFDHELSDLSAYVETASTDSSLAGSIPSEVMLIEGFAAGEMTFTLAGEHNGLLLPAVFSPYNGNSPLYNDDHTDAEVIYKIGVETSVGTVWYDQFVGNIRRAQVKRRAGTVTLSALDRAEKLRHPVNLPIWAISSWHSMRGWSIAQLCDAHWVIDHCLLTGDVSTRPYRPVKFNELTTPQSTEPRSGIQFWLSGNGSWLPNIGYPDSVRVQGYPKMEAGGLSITQPFGTPHPAVAVEAGATGRRPRNLGAMGNDATGYRPSKEPVGSDNRLTSFFKQYRGADLESVGTYAFHWIGFTLIKIGTNATWWQTNTTIPIEVRLGNQIVARLRITSGQVRAELQDLYNGLQLNTAYMTIPTTGESSVIEARLKPGGAAANATQVRLSVDGVFGTAVTATWVSYAGPDDFTQGGVAINHKVGIQDAYWQNRFVANASFGANDLLNSVRKPAKYGAIIDRGLNKLTQLTTRSYPDAWSLIADIAAAELGAVFWDEAGRLRFWNRDTIISKQLTAVRTLDTNVLEDLGMDDSLDSLRNVVTATARDSTTDDGIVFEANSVDQFVVLAATQVYFRFRVDTMGAVIPWKVPRYGSIVDANVPLLWTDAIKFGYVVQFETSPGVWQEQNHFTSGVDIQAFIDHERNLVIRVWNGYAYNARFSTNGGSPALRLSGTALTAQDDVIVTASDPDSVAQYGPRNLPVAGDWVQAQPEGVTSLTSYLLQRTVSVIPAVDGIPIPGDPRLQLGDTLRLRDPDGLGAEMLVQILGIKRTLSRDGGLKDVLTLELLRPAGIGFWDSEQYGRWDDTFIWSA